MKKKNSEIDPLAYRTDLVKALVGETLKMIKAERKEFGQEFCDQVILDLVASLIASGLHGVLERGSISGPVQGRYETTMRDFREFKTGVQGAVEVAFEQAFTMWNPNTFPDYECKITCIESGEVKGGVLQ